jgi:hypothetical protein
VGEVLSACAALVLFRLEFLCAQKLMQKSKESHSTAISKAHNECSHLSFCKSESAAAANEGQQRLSESAADRSGDPDWGVR